MGAKKIQTSNETPRKDPYRTLGRSVRKEISPYSETGVFSDTEHFINDIIDGFTTRYIVSKTDHSIKSRKTYFEEKLHGESAIFNEKGEITSREVFALGTLVFKYILDENAQVIKVEIVDQENTKNLPTSELEILKSLMVDKPEWFK